MQVMVRLTDEQRGLLNEDDCRNCCSSGLDRWGQSFSTVIGQRLSSPLTHEERAEYV